MKRGTIFGLTIAGIVFGVAVGAAADGRNSTESHRQGVSMYQPLADFVAARQAEFDQIDADRKVQLDRLSEYVRAQRDAERAVRLLFVCTHNSRRSHLAQLWTAVAAEVYGIPVSTYSGGTESTAFNPRAVAALQRAGFEFQKTTDDANPIYHVRHDDDRPALTCFSKTIDGAPNPREGFAAVMVCSDADRACPAVRGATHRLAIPYGDPKISDGSKLEASTYDQRCAQIAREMLYVMSRVAG